MCSVMSYVDAFKQSRRDSRRRSYVTIHSGQEEKKYHMGHDGGGGAGRLVPEAKGEVSKSSYSASLVAQWLRICLLMQRTRFRALVWEDPTCRGATRPVSHNY